MGVRWTNETTDPEVQRDEDHPDHEKPEGIVIPVKHGGNSLSLGFCSSSSPIWYCRPEQPPPTTRIRRAYFSCISAGVSSRILEAAESVMVIILILLCPKVCQRAHAT